MAHTSPRTIPHIKRWLLLLAVAAGLLAGCFPAIGRAFSLSRTLVFVPFFLAGAFWGDSIMNRVSRMVWLPPLTLPVAVGGYFFAAKLPISFLYQAQGYSSFGLAGLSGIEARVICYITAAACSVLVLFLCPKRKYVWTQWGGNILMPYLLHPVFIGCLGFIPYTPPIRYPGLLRAGTDRAFQYSLVFQVERRPFSLYGSEKQAAASQRWTIDDRRKNGRKRQKGLILLPFPILA